MGAIYLTTIFWTAVNSSSHIAKLQVLEEQAENLQNLQFQLLVQEHSSTRPLIQMAMGQ